MGVLGTGFCNMITSFYIKERNIFVPIICYPYSLVNSLSWACEVPIILLLAKQAKSKAWLGLVWFGLAWLGLAWFGLAWLGLVWLGLVWLGLETLSSNAQ